MSYRIDPDRALTAEVRRIAEEQTDKALAELRGVEDRDVVEAVHDARKRCKKVRGLVRLVRPALGDAYGEANRTFRDAARAIAGYRDDHALLDTFDRLVSIAYDERPPNGLVAVRELLEARSRESTQSVGRVDDRVGTALELLEHGADMIGSWTLDDDGWDAIAGGLKKTYGRGVDALAAVDDDPSPTRHHELRKRAKYTWYHVRLLRDTAPAVLRPLAASYHALSDALGDAHDLAVLLDRLAADVDEVGGPDVVQPVVAFVDGRRRELEQRGVALARRLYVESPKRFTARLGGYWAGRQDHGDQPTAGALEDVWSNDHPDDLDELTVGELRDVARAADLPGRSGKRRQDLIGALRAAGVRHAD